MMPQLLAIPPLLRRYALFYAGLLFICGCTSPLFRGQSPDAEDLVEGGELDDGVNYVGDLTVPWGTRYLKVEAVALATQLAGTGSDPPPSPLRDQLIKDMQTHEVDRPAKALGSRDTAMVLVRGFIPPGAQKEDTFDVEVRIPSRSQTTSLRDGWLMQTRLRELQVVNNAVHSGHVIALAQGPILVDALFNQSAQEVAETRGRVPGGGVVVKPRMLGLAIRDDHSSVRTSAMISAAINQRFHHFDRGVKKGVAKPTRDNMIELAVQARYKQNIARYIRVVQAIALGESAADRVVRFAALERMLLEPTSAEMAALRLEAIGQEGAVVLRKGLKSNDGEVRFHAAEALAYLDEADAAKPLFEAARDEWALRWRALAALSVLEHFEAEDALVELLNAASAETRYGAFRALRARNPRDPLVRGQVLGQEFGYHVVGTTGDPMIHFSRVRRPEIVLFGHGQVLRSPPFLYAGKEILIKGVDERTVRLSRFSPGKEDKHEVCATDLDEVIRAIVRLGGGYEDVLMAMTTAKKKGCLASRVEVDALARPGRTYHRDEDRTGDEDLRSDRPHLVNPVPEMFSDRLGSSRQRLVDGEDDEVPNDIDPPEDERTRKGFFGRIRSWFSG